MLVTGQDSPELRRNRLLNGTGRPATLLLAWTSNLPRAGGQSGRARRRGAIHHRAMAVPRVRAVPRHEERGACRCGAGEARSVGNCWTDDRPFRRCRGGHDHFARRQRAPRRSGRSVRQFEVIMWQDHSPAEMAGAVSAWLHRGQADGHRWPDRLVANWSRSRHRACLGMWRTSRPTSFHHITATRQESPSNWLFDAAKARLRADPADTAVFVREPSLSDPVWLGFDPRSVGRRGAGAIAIPPVILQPGRRGRDRRSGGCLGRRHRPGILGRDADMAAHAISGPRGVEPSNGAPIFPTGTP